MAFCFDCGQKLISRIFLPENLLRLRCENCGYIHYENPKVLVGVLATFEEKILWIRRGTEPQKGLWSIPAGYLELNETLPGGATRELYEEVGIKAKDSELKTCLISTVQYPVNGELKSEVRILFRVNLADSNYNTSEEAEEVAFFSNDEVPWNDIAYPTTTSIIKNIYRDIQQDVFGFYSCHSSEKVEYIRSLIT
jgi:ADP-ribose pyrophosphatase YjhB (NUDIX family)